MEELQREILALRDTPEVRTLLLDCWSEYLRDPVIALAWMRNLLRGVKLFCDHEYKVKS